MHFDNKTNNYKCIKIYKVFIILNANSFSFIKTNKTLFVFYFNTKSFNKNKPKLKHVIIKAIQCTLLSICVLLHMLQVLSDFKHLTTVKSYDELLHKVKKDHYVCKIGLLKIIKNK